MGGITNYFRPTDIYTSQRLMLCLMNFAGYLPLQIEADRNGRRLRTSTIGCAFSVLFIAINVAVFGSMTSERLQTLVFLLDRPNVSQIGTTVKLISIYIMVPLLYGSCLRTAKILVTYMQHIVNIDKRLSLIGIDIDYRKGFYFSISVFVFVVVHFILALGMSTWQNGALVERATGLQEDPNTRDMVKDATLVLWLSFVTHHVPLVAMTIIKCFYASITVEIRIRFEGMNRMLKCMFEPSPVRIADIESIESTAWNVRNNSQMYNLVDELCSIHSDLCDTCAIVSDYFSLKMVAVVATGFIAIVMNGFYFSLVYKDVHKAEKLVELIYTCTESVCISLAIILACNSVHRISEENEKCSTYVHKILNSINAPDIKNKLLEFSLQLINRKVEFSGHGLFVINRGLLLAIAEAITTYFLISLEFHSNQQSN